MEIDRALITAALSVALIVQFVPGASAQTTQPVSFTTEQRDVIRAHVVQERRPSVSVPVDQFPAVGSEVPTRFEVFWMPPSAGLNPYRYAIINQRTVVLDYEHRRVIDILDGRLP